MAIEIKFLSNIVSFLRGTKSMDDALEDVADALDDVARDAQRAGDKTEDSLQDAERASDRLERSFRDVRDAAKDVEKATDDIGDGGKKGFGKASEASGEFKSEALQNLSEVSSSFTGDIQSIGDLAQGTFGGLASSLPGVLGAAGAGAAVGVGLITAGFVAAEEKRKALEERANDLASAYIEAGTNVLSALAVADASSAVLTDPEKRKEAQAYADALGIELPDAIRAYVGDANALAVVDKIAAEAKRDNRAIADQQRESLKALTPEQQKQIEKNQAAIAAQKELNGVVADANATFEAQQAVLFGLINDAEGATQQVDELGNTLYTLPEGEQIVVSADTKQATTDVTKFKGDVDTIPPTAVVKVEVDSSAWDNWTPKMKRALIAYSAVAADKKTLWE